MIQSVVIVGGGTAGLGWEPPRGRPALAVMDPSAARRELGALERDGRALVTTLADCYSYLASIN